MSNLNLEHLRQWIGRGEEAADIITPHLLLRLRATLFRDPVLPAPGEETPLTTHWCLAPPVVSFREIAQDGHPAKGGFLPPVPLPRRMWAGGKLEFFERLRVGDEVRRASRISDVVEKKGSSGTLCFVTVSHEISTSRGLAIRERQDLVYRDVASAPPAATAAPAASSTLPAPSAQHRMTFRADPVLLFRYSALTFNGHRIHYDRQYAIEEENYRGLVVHGPLQATLLAEFAADLRDGALPKSFEYRGVAPLFEGGEFSLNANEVEGGLEVWSADSLGQPAMKGRVTW